MPFGVIGRTGPGMRQVVEFVDRSTGRGTFRGEFGARHCNHWEIYGVRVRQCHDAALFPNYFWADLFPKMYTPKGYNESWKRVGWIAIDPGIKVEYIKPHGWAQRCKAGWRMTIDTDSLRIETGKLSRERHQLQHSAADPIHIESQAQMKPTGQSLNRYGLEKKILWKIGVLIRLPGGSKFLGTSGPITWSIQIRRSECDTTVVSNVNSLPPCQGIKVSPSGRLPSNLATPVGSLVAGIPAEDKARAMMSLIAFVSGRLTGGLLASQAVQLQPLTVSYRSMNRSTSAGVRHAKTAART